MKINGSLGSLGSLKEEKLTPKLFSLASGILKFVEETEENYLTKKTKTLTTQNQKENER